MSKTIISRAGIPYLRRWQMFRGKAAPNVYMHHFLSDDEDCPHDHPFDFWALTLWGKGEEVMYRRRGNQVVEVGRRRLCVGVLRRYRAENIHRICRVKGLRTICLIVRRRRNWGFWTPSGWVPWHLFSPTALS